MQNFKHIMASIIVLCYCFLGMQSLGGMQYNGFSRHKIYSNSSIAYACPYAHFECILKNNNMHRTPDTARHEFSKILLNLCGSRSYRDVFTDLLDLAIYPLVIADAAKLCSNPLHKYNTQEQTQFTTLLQLLGEQMDNYTDAMGDLFMEYLSFGRNGQFFTPQPLCDAMALMTIGNTETTAKQTVLDCACGSGRMLLAAAKINRDMHYTGADIDITCVKMTAINLAYNSLTGEAAWMNALSQEHYGSFIISIEPFTKIPMIHTLPARKTPQLAKLVEATKAMPEYQKQQVIQQTLF